MKDFLEKIIIYGIPNISYIHCNWMVSGGEIMGGQEKITLNLSAVDLAKIDFLVEQGFYSSRSEFIGQL
jgi:hypothetical protein